MKGLDFMKNIDDEIQKAQTKIEQLTHRQDRLASKLKIEERKKRTRRLIEREAILESVIGNATDFTNEQIQALLIQVFSSEFARSSVKNCEDRPDGHKIPCYDKGALIHLNRCVAYSVGSCRGHIQTNSLFVSQGKVIFLAPLLRT